MSFFKSFAAAAMYLMANGYDFTSGSVFKSADATVEVVKTSSGYYRVKEV